MRRWGQFRVAFSSLYRGSTVYHRSCWEGLLDRAQNINISQSEEETGSPGDFL